MDSCRLETEDSMDSPSFTVIFRDFLMGGRSKKKHHLSNNSSLPLSIYTYINIGQVVVSMFYPEHLGDDPI